MSLPLEIWQIVLESIPPGDKHTLSSLALVSRVVYAAAFPVLYFEVQITGRESQERFYERIQLDDPFNPAGYVREYTVIVASSDIASGNPYAHLNLGALARMQHLCKLAVKRGNRVANYTVTNTIEDPSWALPELRELRIRVHLYLTRSRFIKPGAPVSSTRLNKPEFC
ncbi:hypothetical protein CYLTODRAFT_459785 [Cylindrobasidium torrendii FP15055 ss-10]|uniref:F-box domain-containing protein n=1 Tax=Cylindrobasidium torrendii FP15055 ss-10 TaxID=1314674 RepID=A0A0D7ATI3_9AGAR|nr:hypothetical protein CYLTODRAFT_459785 [Cylindrobasidium torrendii FP15055 ss-10]